MYPLEGKRIWIAGQRGMVGSALARRLTEFHCEVVPDRADRPDLRRQSDVEEWLAAIRPDAIIIAAARVGGILANDSCPVDFLEDNLLIEANIIGTAHRLGVERLLFLGSSCIYPRLADQPIRENALLTGPLEPTINGMQSLRSLVSNLFRLIGGSMAETTSLQCRPIFTDRAIISISTAATSCLR